MVIDIIKHYFDTNILFSKHIKGVSDYPSHFPQVNDILKKLGKKCLTHERR